VPNYLGLPYWRNFSELRDFCKSKPGLLAHHPRLRIGYEKYWSACRNPLNEWEFSQSLGQELTQQLRSRYKSGAELPKFIKERLHRMQGLSACPYCGLQKNVTTDHYLPKQHFPQYAALSSNLVPACTDCQMNGAKGEWFPGASEKKEGRPMRRPVRGFLERLLHPYFDKFLRSRVLRIDFIPAETLLDISLSSISNDKRIRALVNFHIGKLNIQRAATSAVRAYWSGLISRIRHDSSLAESRDSIHKFLQGELRRVYSECRSVNSIEFIFYASILRDQIKSDFLIKIASRPPQNASNQLIPKGRRYK